MIKSNTKIKISLILLFLIFYIIVPNNLWCQEKEKNEALQLNVFNKKEGVATVVRIFVLMTLLSILPAILFTMTCFTRILIVLAFARQSFGIQNLPPNPVLLGIALFLTLFVMTPVWEDIYQNAYSEYANKKIGEKEALSRAKNSMRSFMLKHVRDKDLALMLYLAKKPLPKTEKDIDTIVLIPAFIISELTIAFQMGFLILLPFLIIDIIVASTLLAMGMMMLPPLLLEFPLKYCYSFLLMDGISL